MNEQTINKPSNNIVTDTEEFLKNLTPEQRDTLRLMRHALQERDQSNRSFWRAVYQGFKQGINQSFEKLDRLFSGKDER